MIMESNETVWGGRKRKTFLELRDTGEVIGGALRGPEVTEASVSSFLWLEMLRKCSQNARTPTSNPRLANSEF